MDPTSKMLTLRYSGAGIERHPTALCVPILRKKARIIENTP